MNIQQYEITETHATEIIASVGTTEVAVVAAFLQKWYAFTNTKSYKYFCDFMKGEEILPDIEIHLAR